MLVGQLVRWDCGIHLLIYHYNADNNFKAITVFPKELDTIGSASVNLHQLLKSENLLSKLLFNTTRYTTHMVPFPISLINLTCR